MGPSPAGHLEDGDDAAVPYGPEQPARTADYQPADFLQIGERRAAPHFRDRHAVPYGEGVGAAVVLGQRSGEHRLEQLGAMPLVHGPAVPNGLVGVDRRHLHADPVGEFQHEGGDRRQFVLAGAAGGGEHRRHLPPERLDPDAIRAEHRLPVEALDGASPGALDHGHEVLVPQLPGPYGVQAAPHARGRHLAEVIEQRLVGGLPVLADLRPVGADQGRRQRVDPFLQKDCDVLARSDHARVGETHILPWLEMTAARGGREVCGPQPSRRFRSAVTQAARQQRGHGE